VCRLRYSVPSRARLVCRYAAVLLRNRIFFSLSSAEKIVFIRRKTLPGRRPLDFVLRRRQGEQRAMSRCSSERAYCPPPLSMSGRGRRFPCLLVQSGGDTARTRSWRAWNPAFTACPMRWQFRLSNGATTVIADQPLVTSLQLSPVSWVVPVMSMTFSIALSARSAPLGFAFFIHLLG